jgi:hypothetical protein
MTKNNLKIKLTTKKQLRDTPFLQREKKNDESNLKKIQPFT